MLLYEREEGDILGHDGEILLGVLLGVQICIHAVLEASETDKVKYCDD